MELKKKRFGKINIVKKDTFLWVVIVLLTLPHMNPGYLNQVRIAEFVVNIWRIISFAVVLVWMMLKKRKISLIVLLIGIQQLFLFMTTYFHSGTVYNTICLAFSAISIVILYDITQEKNRIFLSAQLFCFEFVIYVNLFTMIISPRGLYITYPMHYTKNWFLGYYNGQSQFFIPALLFAWLYEEKTNKRWRTLFLSGAIWCSAIISWSGGILVSISCMFLLFFFLKKRTRIFNYYNYWFIGMLSPIIVIILGLQNKFKWLIDGILHKWGSITGRIDVWYKTIKLISGSPIIGHGTQDPFVVRAMETGVLWQSHAHNLLLEILYQGGIIGLVLWVIVIIVAGRKVYQYRNTRESMIIATAFAGWCITALVEPYMTAFLMGMFVIAYHSNREEAFKKSAVSAEIAQNPAT